jgi:hypothetical protein
MKKPGVLLRLWKRPDHFNRRSMSSSSRSSQVVLPSLQHNPALEEKKEKKRLRFLALIRKNPEGDIHWGSLTQHQVSTITQPYNITQHQASTVTQGESRNNR